MLWAIVWQKATGGAVTDQAGTLATDQTMPVDANSNPLFPIPMLNMMWWAGGATLTRVRVNAPKFRYITRSLIRPIDAQTTPSSRPIIMESWRHPLSYNAVEPINLLQSDTASETPNICGVFGDGNRNAAQGDMYTARFTTTFTPTANAWTASGNITFDDTLPAGQYAIIGLDTFSTGLVAARVIALGPPLPGTIPNIRPGFVFPTSNNDQSTRYIRYGYLGELVRFVNTALPQLEIFNTAATANPEGYFDLVKTA